MKPVLFLICVAMVILFNIESYSQKILWKKLLTDQSFGESVSSTRDGNFILGALQFEIGIPLVALFDAEGNNSWTRKICKTCGYTNIVFSKELEDGRIFLVTSKSDLIITDHTGAQIDTMINLGSLNGNKETVSNVLDYNNELIISSATNINSQTHDAIIRHIRTEDLKITSQENLGQLTGIISRMAIMKDSSLIELETNPKYNIVRRMNSASQIIWEKQIDDEEFRINDIIVTNDQKILIVGTLPILQSSFKEVIGSLLVAIHSNGDTLWRKVYSPPSLQFERGTLFTQFNRIKESKDGDFIVTGSEGFSYIAPSSFVIVSKIDAKGELVWKYTEQFKLGGNRATDFLFDEDQNIIVVGSAGYTDYPEPERAFILKLSNHIVSINNYTPDYFSLHPIPCSDELIIENKNQQIKKIELFTIDGQHVKSIENNNTAISVNTSMLTPGIYLCKIYSLEGFSVRKFVKI